MVLKVDELRISKRNGQEDMDATKGAFRDAKNFTPLGCNKSPYEQLQAFSMWGRSDQALWHFFDDCLPEGGGTNGIAMIAGLCANSARSNSGITYLSPSTWATFAHEVGHTLGAKHPFEAFSGPQGSFGGLMDYSNHYALQADGTTMKAFNTDSVRSQICGHLQSQIASSSCDGHVVAAVVACGDGIVAAGSETCECADGSKSCRFCVDCQLASGKECTRDAVDHKGDCFCDVNGKFTNCDGVCGPNGSCQGNHNCGLLDESWVLGWTKGALGVSCGPDKQNSCKIVCADGRSNPMNCNTNFDGFSSVAYLNGISRTRPVTFMPDGTKCVDANGAWSTCASNDDNTEIVCTEVACGNGHVDAGEECDCATVGSTSCTFCKNCKLDAGRECSSESADRTGCNCDANGMLAACDGVCGPNGICQRNHDCGNLAGWLWQSKLETEVCSINNINTCKVICADGRNSPATCNSYFDKHVVNNRPVTFMPDGTKCLDSNNVWSTCESKMEWRCGNNGCKDVYTDIWCKETASAPETVCKENTHVVDNACVSCPAGTANAQGDTASGADTRCDAIRCAENQRVAANRCIVCPAGTTNIKGDSASGRDTHCDVLKVAQMKRGSCKHKVNIAGGYAHIGSADNCKTAAALLGFGNLQLHIKNKVQWQRGCFEMKGRLVWNQHGTGKETNAKNRRSICKEISVAESPEITISPISAGVCAGRPVELMNKGSCKHKSNMASSARGYSHIETASDCLEAAATLGTASNLIEKNNRKWQIGCMILKGKLYWNRHATGKENNAKNRKSICCVNDY